MEQSHQSDQSHEQQNQIKKIKSRFFYIKIFISIVGIANLIITLYALIIFTNFFTYLFSITEQKAAKQFLYQNYKKTIALAYILIIGQLITFVSSILVLTKFTQKKYLVVLHSMFFVVLVIITGLAISESSLFLTNQVKEQQSCSLQELICLLIVPFKQLSFRINIISGIFIATFLIFTISCHMLALYETNHQKIFILQQNSDQINSETQDYNSQSIIEAHHKNRYKNDY